MPALRILQIEDSVDEAELTCIELRAAGLDVECRRVDDEAGLRQALAEFRPQLILSDLGLPGFCAERALEVAREHAPGARFIIFSGSVDHDDPADGALRGADGRVCKSDAARLPSLIRQLLEPARPDGPP